MGLVIALGLGLTACGGDDGGDETTDAGDGGNAGDAGTASPEDAPPFTVAMPGVPGVSMVPLLSAIDVLREQGYEIETPWIAESELTVEGTASGDFEFSSGTSQSTMLAIEQGAPLKWIADRVANEWTVYGVDDIADCAGLDGRRLAIHSEGAISTAMVHLWMDTDCPGTKAEEVVIAGSPNRLQALVGGQIDASPLELADAIQLEETRDGFNRLTSFSEDIPELKTTTYYGNEQFMSENPQIVHDLLKAIVEENRKIAEDPAYLAELIPKYVEDFDTSVLEIVSEEYAGLGMFSVNAELSPDEVQFTIDTFAEGGITGDGLTVEQIVDPSYLEAVLEEIGRV
ncbi:ABC transporter substrate-binding protein [Jiangella mangrovi]|uniref:NitT/TauT family transport system substrate-binding protein n=1 Tax=Jiangella mangrovi TaxID=1524084 RepID=A0A7W9GTN2_9ACTN|nr:ABC transporter substrate-binding protein [Jiangella mangrovi]MBB5789501.1 NitT/TauT family transport system substrate-binding protein [Jiangella mangrovi]